MLDGPRLAPGEHPLYTVDAALACGAATYGGNHTCSCVYRRSVCDENEHLCMCGGTWSDDRACYCKTTREKENTPMWEPPKTVPVKVTVSIEVNGKVQDRIVYVQPLNPADEIGLGSAVREMLRYSATETAKGYAAPSAPFSDDLFAAQKPEPKRSCCSGHADDCEEPVDDYRRD